jgi:hypothetical protein
MVGPASLKRDHIFEINALVGEYSFRISEVPAVKIRVKIWEADVSHGGDRYFYTISHLVHTPTQIGPYSPSAPFGATELATIRRAIKDTLSFYIDAISEGHTPCKDWFIKNEDFD